MAIRRVVTRANAELNTYRQAREKVAVLPNGAKKAKAQLRVNDFKGRINARTGDV